MVGYKQTDIGLIPVDWEVKKLGAVTDVIGGGTPSTSIKEYWNGNINWFTPTEISEIKYSYSSKRKITSLGLNNSSARMLPIGTILLTSRAGIGDLSILGTESSTNQGFQSLVTKKEINNEFLYYLMKTKKNVLLEYASGSTFLEISPKNLKSIQIPLPPLPEQEAIAEVLSDTDELIGALEKRIAKKQLMKQGAMQTLLTPKVDWEVKKLGEIGETYGGLSGKSKKDFEDGNYPYIPFMNIMSNPIIDKNYVDFVNIKKGEIHNKALKGDLFFNGSSETPEEVGMCSILMNDIPNLYLNSFCFGFRFYKTTNENGLFFVYYFRSNEGRKHFRLLAQGATRYNLSKTQLLKMEIPFPPIQEQNRIATILSDMDNEIDALEKKLSKTKELKQGLMQQLLTGKIRLV